MICFSPFLFSAILSENGQLTSHPQDAPHDARSKLSRHPTVRVNLVRAALDCVGWSVGRAKKIAGPYSAGLLDVAL